MSSEQENMNNTAKEKTSKINLRTMLVIIAIIIFAIITVIVIRAEYIKVLEIGESYVSVYKNKMENCLIVSITSFFITFVITYISNSFIKKGLKAFFEAEKKEVPKLPNKSTSFIFALIAGMLCTIFLIEKFSVFSNAAVFGRTDGVFGLDISYYMFTLPFVESVLQSIMILLIALIVYTGFYYVIAFNYYFDGVDAEIIKKSIFVKQLVFYLIVLVVVFAIYIIFNSQNIFTGDMVSIQDEEETKLAGAGFTEITIELWGYRVFAVVIVFSVCRLLKYIKKSNFNQCVVSIVVVPVYLVCLFLLMMYFEYIYIGSNELDRQKDYIRNNIENTKEAYGININQTDINSYNSITFEEVGENEDVINNIPLISSDVTLDMIDENQESVGYYSYNRTMLANYNNQLVYITPREILANNAVSYNNRTFKYTHGFSAIISTATDNDNDGYAEYLLSNYSGEFTSNPIREPRIYFGLETNSIIATNTKFGKEYDYPITATKYEENVYSGKAGLNLGFWDRLVVGLSNRNLKLAVSSKINKDTKIITNRNILERVKIILPNIKYDDNPYLVISKEGKLIWVIDGYTTSNEYPYSQMTVLVSEKTGTKEKINYIRNSIKVLVDAYDGTTTFYITDRTDPIAITYENMYPELFSKKEISEDIAEHFIYPEFLYSIQAGLIGMYHDVSEDTLYRGDDIWKITPAANSKGSKMLPFYTMLKTIDQKENEFGIVVTFNKEKKQSITGYLVGTYRNGKPVLSLYKFNGNSNVPGVVNLNNQIEQDSIISAELEQLNTAGVKLVKNIMVVPIEDTLIYVEPVYQVNLNEQEGAIPVLKKVIVASGNRVTIGNSMQEALTKLFSDYAVDLEFVDTEDIEDLVDAIIRANKNLSESMSANDFEMIGKDLSRLENLINQLEIVREKEIKKQEEEAKEANKSGLIDSAQDLIDKAQDIIEDGIQNANIIDSISENIVNE